MIRTLTLLLSLLLSLTGCGSSEVAQQSTSAPSFFPLRGTWTGQFPPTEGDEGVELHFQPDFAFFVQNGQRVARQRLLTETVGSQLRLTLTSETNAQNQAVFTGSFVDANTLAGRYVNSFLQEDFDLTLVARPDLNANPVP